MAWYPKSCYSIREDITRKNREEYDRKREAWWDKAEEMYPGFCSRPLIERLNLRESINEAVGYSL